MKKLSFFHTPFLTLSDHQIPDNKKSGTGWDTDNKFFTVFCNRSKNRDMLFENNEYIYKLNY